MRTLRATDLPELPLEVKNLVRDGVYALYVLRTAVLGAGEYVLVTRGKDQFILSHDGTVVEGTPDPSPLPIEQAVTFAGLNDSVRINFG